MRSAFYAIARMLNYSSIHVYHIEDEGERKGQTIESVYAASETSTIHIHLYNVVAQPDLGDLECDELQTRATEPNHFVVFTTESTLRLQAAWRT